MASYQLIPQFLIVLVVTILLLCTVAWWKSNRPHNSTQDSHDPTAWLLFGLLTVAVFALGAFAMFVLLRFGG